MSDTFFASLPKRPTNFPTDCIHVSNIFLLPIRLGNDWRWLLNIFPENVAFDKVWKPSLQFIRDEGFGWDHEDLCKEC
jgi:hypothetical protein